MIDFDWLSDCLCDLVRWQLANPDADPLAGPEVPWAGRRVWSIFLELNATRTTGMGVNPIGMLEIQTWSRLHREPIRPFELTIIRAMDSAFIKEAMKTVKSEPKPEVPKVSARPFSLSLFDAWFGVRDKKVPADRQ